MSASERCELPDTIIGLGGAGKRVVYHYLQTEWILNEGLEPRDDAANPNFNAFVIDTATDEQENMDLPTVESINERIVDLCREEFDRGPENIDTRLKYRNPLDGTNDQYLTEVGLTSESTVREVARSSSLRAWWLEENEAMLTGGEYGGGVVRRRGLSKALYHISQTGDKPLSDVIARAEGSVAMVVALGGGTGSGMFLDVAKRLKSAEGNADVVNLFAIVPGTGEHRRKKANAHAALSEIEYLCLRGKNPFKNVVLIPYGPGRAVDSEEFHDSVVQTIVARESHGDLDSYLDEASNDGPPVYAPFTVALSQINRYAVEDKKSAKKEVADFCERKLESLEEELALYERLESFITEEREAESAGEALEKAANGGQVLMENFSLTEEEIHDLKERYDGLKQFVDIDHFSVLDYDAPERWRELLEDFESQYRSAHSDSSDLEVTERMITDVPNQVETQLEAPDEIYPSEKERTDRQLETIIRQELQAIKRRGDIQRSIHLVEDGTIRKGLEAALDPEIGSIAASSDINERKNSLNQDIESREHNLKLLESFLTDREIGSRLDEHRQEWRRDVESELGRLIAIDENREELERLLKKLDRDVQSTIQAIQNATHPDGVPDDPLEFDSFEDLNELLSETGADEVDEIRLTDTLTALANARKEKLQAQDVSLIGRLITSSGERHRRRYGQFLDSVDRELVSVSPDRSDFEKPFQCSFERDDGYAARLDELDRYREELPTEICETFRSYLSNPAVEEPTFRAYVEDRWNGELPVEEGRDDDLGVMEWPGGDVDEFVEELRTELAPTKDLSEETTTEFLNELCRPGDDRTEAGIVYRGVEATSLRPVEDYRDELEAETERLKDERDGYRRLQEIIETHGGRQELVTVDRDSLSEFDISTDEEYTYVRQVASEQALLQYDDIVDAELWEPDNDERETLENSLRQFAKTAASLDSRIGIKHNTLEVPTAASAGNDTMYQGHFVLPVFMSRCFKTEEFPSDEVFEAVETEYRDRIHLLPGDDGYAAKSVGFGGEWDVAQTTFIGGVCLDNFQPLVQPGNGYKAAYKSERKDLIENIRIRHTHGLDGLDEDIADPGHGGFVRREETFNLDDTRPDGDRATFIELDTGPLVDHLFDESYVVTEQFESTIELDES